MLGTIEPLGHLKPSPVVSTSPSEEKVWAYSRKQAGMSQVNGFKRNSHTPLLCNPCVGYLVSLGLFHPMVIQTSSMNAPCFQDDYFRKLMVTRGHVTR